MADTRSQRRQTRRTLFDSATTAFAEHGFEGASLREIAGQANVNTALVSYYWDGKGGLWVLVCRVAAVRLLHAFRRAAKKTAASQHAVELVDAITEEMANESHATRIALWSTWLPEGELRRKTAHAFAPLVKEISEHVRTMQARASSPLKLDAGLLLIVGMLNQMYFAPQVQQAVFGADVEDPSYRNAMRTVLRSAATAILDAC